MTRREREKQLQRKKMISVISVIIIILLIFGAVFFKNNSRTILKDMGLRSGFEYDKDKYPKVNELVTSYLTALSSKDQAALQSMVADPSQFSDMTVYNSRAKVITGYSDTVCYTLPGIGKEDMICYAVSNLTLADIESKPLDLMMFYIIKNDDGDYVIDNSEYSDELKSYIDEANSSDDIQGLFTMVEEDNKKCLSEDEAFRNFYNAISGGSGN